MVRRKQVLLIGALGGLGASTTQVLSEKGWRVFAADVQEAIFTRFEHLENVVPLHLDITDLDSVGRAYAVIAEQTEWLDAVIHMAGMLAIGSLVELSVSELERALEVNLLGVYRVHKQFLPLLLAQKGRVIILSSEVGKQQAAPFNGIYAISKHALEAYSDALRRELAFLGIKVIKIQPGPFKTSMTKNAESLFTNALEKSTYFKKNLAKGITYLPNVYKNAHEPELVAQVIWKALISYRPKIAYSVRPDIPRLLLDFLPTAWADRLIRWGLS